MTKFDHSEELFIETIFPKKNQSLGKFMNTLVSLVLDLAQMVLAVFKHNQMTRLIPLKNYYQYNYSKKTIAEEVLDLGVCTPWCL